MRPLQALTALLSTSLASARGTIKIGAVTSLSGRFATLRTRTAWWA